MYKNRKLHSRLSTCDLYICNFTSSRLSGPFPSEWNEQQGTNSRLKFARSRVVGQNFYCGHKPEAPNDLAVYKPKSGSSNHSPISFGEPHFIASPVQPTPFVMLATFLLITIILQSRLRNKHI